MDGYNAETQTMTATYWGIFDSNTMTPDGNLRVETWTGVTDPEALTSRFYDYITAATDPIGQLYRNYFGGFFQVITDNILPILILMGVFVGVRMLQRALNKSIKL